MSHNQDSSTVQIQNGKIISTIDYDGILFFGMGIAEYISIKGGGYIMLLRSGETDFSSNLRDKQMKIPIPKEAVTFFSTMLYFRPEERVR